MLATWLANKTQHCWAQHVASVCTPCCVLSRVVATCWKLLDEVWNWSNFRANKCQHFYLFAVIEAWSNNVAFVCTAHPTMLRRRTRTTCHVSTQIHANKKSTWRRRWKTSQSPLYSHLKTHKRLHTSANIAQQETTLLGPTMLRVVASVCTGLNSPWFNFSAARENSQLVCLRPVGIVNSFCSVLSYRWLCLIGPRKDPTRIERSIMYAFYCIPQHSTPIKKKNKNKSQSKLKAVKNCVLTVYFLLMKDNRVAE